MEIKTALATLADSRDDFYVKRESLVKEELKSLDWLRQKVDLIEGEVIRSIKSVSDFAQAAKSFGVQSLIMHIPIWADPILAVKLHNHIQLPLLLLGNCRPETSSIVGILGSGGALDQIGCAHTRVFDHTNAQGRKAVMAFVRASAARSQLRGQTLGLFGGRSLGIFTAVADTAQWQQLFGVDIEYIDQTEIINKAQTMLTDEVQHHIHWLSERVGGIEYGDSFTAQGLERQVRSYLATQALLVEHNVDFVGVKCQRELSDGYASQCVSHMLFNGTLDANGEKKAVVHACESDADGALTMQILHLLSAGQPTALLDIRWLNRETGTWTLANCGAIPAVFFATPKDPTGLSNIRITPHVFGRGGGGALPALATPQPVTLARLCRKNGEYWMAVVSGTVEQATADDLKRTTKAFPQALIKSSAGMDFLSVFGSNHIHMVSGEFAQEVMAFCQLSNIRSRLWA